MQRTLSKVMGALSALHQNKMAHRDKLDNVLLCSWHGAV